MITSESILKTLEDKGYLLKKENNYPNLVGIRKALNNDNLFNDVLYLFIWKNNQQSLTVFNYPITTDPGRWYLNHPINKNGCAIVKEGAYKNLWTIGKHQGKYTALVQIGKIKVYRDINKDNVMDFKEDTLQEGYFGVNLHHAGVNSNTVDNWSAGCQVFKNIKDFDEVMRYVTTSKYSFFNYYLLNEKDINS